MVEANLLTFSFQLQIGQAQMIMNEFNDSYPCHQIVNYWMRIYVKRPAL